MKDVLKQWQVLIESKKAAVKISELPIIYAEPVQMNLLFSHLLGNALKFSKGEPVIDISARRVTEEDYSRYTELHKDTFYVAVAIHDNGIGFDQKYATKLFVLFQQLKDIKAEGTGIGLAICKKIMENHQGFIVADGIVGGGATFTVFFPAT
jgi:two-component system CheB/CheR fusion protein